MPLVAGTCLGSHEISSPLGAGGMGDVYRVDYFAPDISARTSLRRMPPGQSALDLPPGKAHLVGAGWSRHLMGGATWVAKQGG
jgi:hypothetical protein